MTDRKTEALIEMDRVSVWLPEGKRILADIDWTVRAGEQWALLGPNGSGKSTLLSLAAAERHPSQGNVTVLGEKMGQTSVWALRERIGHVEPNQQILDWLTAEEVVLTGVTGTVWPMHDRIEPGHRQRAKELLDLVGCIGYAERGIKTLSQGERQRVRLARALIADPELLLLDEPATGLDLPAREALLEAIAALTTARPELATVFVSHHFEELPATTTHAMLLRGGRIEAIGKADDVLTSTNATSCFGFPVSVYTHEHRWFARAEPAPDGVGFLARG